MLNIQTILCDFRSLTPIAFISRHKGARLGSGLHRDVYEVADSKRYVIKINKRPGDFSNVAEWEFYNFLKMVEQSSYLAPCHAISPDGQMLLMSRTTPVALRSDLPKKVPRWMTDLKLTNWGWLSDSKSSRVVCHDYATSLVLNYLVEGGLRRANFHS